MMRFGTRAASPLSLGERDGVRGVAVEEWLGGRASFAYAGTPHPNPLPMGEGIKGGGPP